MGAENAAVAFRNKVIEVMNESDKSLTVYEICTGLDSHVSPDRLERAVISMLEELKEEGFVEIPPGKVTGDTKVTHRHSINRYEAVLKGLI